MRLGCQDAAYYRLAYGAFYREELMIEHLPELLLIVVITITIILLPRINDERPPRAEEPRRATEELHIKPSRK